MAEGLSTRLRRSLIDSWRLRSLAYRLLSSQALAGFWPYRACYRRRIAREQRARLEHPRVVSVETTNACNASCAMCGHRLMRRPQGRMEWKLYQRVVEQVKGWGLESFYLSGYGEPLLDTELADRVSLARRAGIGNTAIVTNASLLDGRRAAELARAGLARVHLSIDAATPQAYARMRPGLDFGQVMENVERLLAMRPRPAVVLQLVLVDQGPDEVRKVIRRFRGRVDRLTVRQAQSWAGRVSLRTREFTPHLAASAAWPPCRYLWDQLNVYWDGTVPACCLDYEAEQPLGDAARQDLAAIWSGPALADLRERHGAGRRDLIPLCRRCGYFSVWW
jgi:MoaA/NifB/PqqE/SkfB family radical SAM enzyme